jgi:hypothetical protein
VVRGVGQVEVPEEGPEVVGVLEVAGAKEVEEALFQG